MTNELGWCLALLGLGAGPALAQESEPDAVKRVELDLAPFRDLYIQPELAPVLSGGTVFVSSSLRLFAVDARRCELLWTGGPPEGWERLEDPSAQLKDLFECVSGDQLVRSAANERVAVAALQLPRAKDARDQWQGIDVTKPIPERRLFAFDSHDGHKLWDHTPPADKELDEGSFAQRMSVLASPLIAGERVLVPCASSWTDVDYHVACYALENGALAWSTPVVTASLQRNVFGRAIGEFAAAPLAFDERRGLVLAQTGLGVVAALDRTSGAIRWRAEYAPIPKPKTRAYGPPALRRVWRIAAPLVVGDVLLATAGDADALRALSLEDGHELWSVKEAELQDLDANTSTLPFDQLLGADEHTLWLGGKKAGAFALEKGLASGGLKSIWTAALDSMNVRSMLAGDQVLYCSLLGGKALDRATGEAVTNLEPLYRFRGWLATEDALFVVEEQSLVKVPRPRRK